MLAFLCSIPYIIILGVILYFFVYKRSQFKNATWSGPFFFENDCLVLNTGVPYPIPFGDIDHVELHYSQRQLDSRWSYGLWVWVVRRNGKTKKTFYKGYRTAQLALPSDMQAALEDKGLRVVMVDGQK